jgi:hypothetical protein
MNDIQPTVATRSRVWPDRLLLGLQVLLALLFVTSGFTLVTGGGETVHTFDEVGAGQWLRVLCGLLDISAAIGLLIRWLAGPAAVGLVAMMIGAVIIEIAVIDGGSPIGPLVPMTAAAIVAWFRRDTITALPDQLRTRATNPLRRRR